MDVMLLRHEREWRRARAALAAIDGHEVRPGARRGHAAGQVGPKREVPDRRLDPDRQPRPIG
jgi:hypothetical protein